VSYDKVIPPGEEGKIKTKVTTKGYGGNRYSKSIHVDTNDPNHAVLELKISGDIKTYAAVIPKSVYLNGKPGEKLAQVVKIIPETPEPFKILKVNSLSGADIKFSLQEIENSGKKFYELTIENTKQTPGRYFDTVSVITDINDQVPISIYVRGNIKAENGAEVEGDATPEVMPAPVQQSAPETVGK
jgi:hypothetical protein